MSDAPIAGWYPDPKSPAAQWRWWDGTEWTAETSARPDAPVARAKDWGWDTPVVAEAPPAKGKSSKAPKEPKEPKAAREPRAAKAPREPKPVAEQHTSANTGAIWLLAFAPWLYAIIAGALFTAGTYALGTDPSMLPLLGAGAGIVALIPLVIIAELDGRALRKRELPAPSSLLVVILAGLIYVLVRSRMLRAEGARSRGPEVALVIVWILTLLAIVAAGLFATSLIAVFSPGSPAIG